jgi:hypothetical protein
MEASRRGFNRRGRVLAGHGSLTARQSASFMTIVIAVDRVEVGVDLLDLSSPL